MARAHFRAVSDPVVESIVIYGGLERRLPVEVKQASAVAKQREHRPENRVEVPSIPETLHPNVSKTTKKLEKAKSSESGLIATSGPDLFCLEFGSESPGRIIAFLNPLAAAAEARGFRIVKSNQALAFVADDETVDLKIIEQTIRSKHDPTETECAYMARWERHQKHRDGTVGNMSNGLRLCSRLNGTTRRTVVSR